MPDIFLSYRRKDSEAIAWHINERLKARFGSGSVFIDVETIPVGSDFRTVIQNEIERCRVLIVIIGPGWLNEQDEYGTRRIEADNDWVRLEIESALSRDVPVIPLLVKNARLPRPSDLPGSIQDLAYRNAAKVRSGVDFNSDMNRLTRGIESYFEACKKQARKTTIIPPVKNIRSWRSRLNQLSLAPSLRRAVPYFIFCAAIVGTVAAAESIMDRVADITSFAGVTGSSSSESDESLTYSKSETKEKLISSGNNSRFEPKETYGTSQASLEYIEDKENAIRTFFEGDYIEAAKQFEALRNKAIADRSDPSRKQAAARVINDPEILIFKNNAIARYRSEAFGEKLYKIAVAAPLTDAEGNLLQLGKNMLQGVAQAQDRVLSVPTGRIDDSTQELESYRTSASDDQLPMPHLNLEVVVVNDRNVPEQAVVSADVALSQRENSDTLAVIGHYTSDSTCDALNAVYSEKKVVVISPLSTLSNLKKDCGPESFFFRTTSSNKVEAASLVQHFLGLSEQTEEPQTNRVAVFYNKEDKFSKDLFEEVQDLLREDGITVESRQLLDVGSKEARENALLEIGSVDSLFVLPDGRNKDSEAFDNAVALIGETSRNIPVFGSNPLYYREIASDMPASKVQNRLFLALDWDFECAPDSFTADMQKYWFGSLNRATAASYEAVQVLASAFKSIDLESPDARRQVRSFLDRLNELPSDSQSGIKSHVFEDRSISFVDGTGDRQETRKRIIVTGSGNEADPFRVVDGGCE